MRQGDFWTFFCFWKKALYEVKGSGLQLSFNNIDSPPWHTVKPKCIKRP